MMESPSVGLKRMIKRGILPVVKENAYDQRNLFRGTVLRPAAAEALLEQGMKLDGYLAWAAERGKPLDNRAREILEALKAQQSQAQEPPDDVVPTEAQHNGFGGERSPGEMSEPCPQGEAKGMKRGMTMGGISL